MEQKNYRFIGQCDSELKRAYPSCGMAGLTGGTLEAITTSKANLLGTRLSHHAAVLLK